MAKKIKKKILITGGNGFLAGRCIEYFIQKNYNVLISSRNYKEYPNRSCIKFYELKNNNYEPIFNQIKNIDYVVHTAGLDQHKCLNNKSLAFKINVQNTIDLVNLSKLNQVKAFIFISTIHVYSFPLKGILNEETNTINKLPYADFKIRAEKAIKKISKDSNTKFIVLRLSNCFGRPAFKVSNSWNLFINDICKQAIMNSKIRINTSGEQQRNFISITELCIIIDKLFQKNINKKFQNFEIFNFGSKKNYSLIDVAKIIQLECFKLFKKSINIERSKKREKKYNFNFNINKISKIGYIYNDYFYKEIRDLLKFYKKNF